MPEYPSMLRIPGCVSEIARGYLACAEWCGLMQLEDEREAEEELELAVSPAWTEQAVKQAEHECFAFLASLPSHIRPRVFDAATEAQIGHDLWLTRNRHGAGFWDGDYPDDLGQALTDAAHAMGEGYAVYDPETETAGLER